MIITPLAKGDDEQPGKEQRIVSGQVPSVRRIDGPILGVALVAGRCSSRAD